MKKLNDVYEALEYLKQGEIITTDGKDQLIIRKNGDIHRFFDGSTYPMKQNEFLDLYKKNNLYLYEEEMLVDEEKDIKYYRDYRK